MQKKEIQRLESLLVERDESIREIDGSLEDAEKSLALLKKRHADLRTQLFEMLVQLRRLDIKGLRLPDTESVELFTQTTALSFTLTLQTALGSSEFGRMIREAIVKFSQSVDPVAHAELFRVFGRKGQVPA